jgi:hypothetical protein
MDLFMSMAVEIWSSLAPTTWFLVLGLLISFNLVRKTLL